MSSVYWELLFTTQVIKLRSKRKMQNQTQELQSEWKRNDRRNANVAQVSVTVIVVFRDKSPCFLFCLYLYSVSDLSYRKHYYCTYFLR